MKRNFLSLLFILVSIASAFADLPFRQHRFDQFKALPLADSTIVFFGNSITNMHEWWEAFGSEQKVLNRGNSGAMTPELLENIGTVIALHPSKLFIGIGTNDLGTASLAQPDSVAGRIARMVELVRTGSPATEIYVQSILPSRVGIRTLDAIKATNARVKELVEPLGATYIDLFDDLAAIPEKTVSYDGLHLTSKGYAIWLNKIAPIVGLTPIYTPEMVENNGGIPNNSFGMRNTYFSAYPVHSSDVLIMGDEMIHGGEWHELLANPSVKNRGTGWGYGGISLQNWINSVEAILDTNGNKEAPSKILLYVGTQPLYAKNADMQAIIADYKALIEKIRQYAPASKTRIELLSLIPRTLAADNDSLTIPFNNLLSSLVSDDANIGYIDIFTPLALNDHSADSTLVDSHNYLTGRGYGAVARTIAPFVPGSKARCPKCIEATYNAISAATPAACIPTENECH
ncbi:MAG: hypothetical protein HDS15_03960 [Bacteroides sp.]|nr:hypothetical protein [Bacteroides sp.]